MTITFYGVRGSVPAPGPTTQRYGGNTSCVCVETDDRVLVLDAGTGIRALGNDLSEDDRDIYVLFTHLHNDHIQGFPFFEPLYDPDRTLHLLHYHSPEHDEAWSPFSLLDGTHFPLSPDDVPADCHHVEDDGLAFLRREGFDIERLSANHPGGAYGYRLHQDDGSYVHLPDNELRPPENGPSSFDDIVAFCEGADLLCHDAQYLPDEIPAKWGWGHSLVSQACALATEAEVGALLLFHHDPARTDEEIDAIQKRARNRLEPTGVACAAAYEGLRIDLRACSTESPEWDIAKPAPPE